MHQTSFNKHHCNQQGVLAHKAAEHRTEAGGQENQPARPQHEMEDRFQGEGQRESDGRGEASRQPTSAKRPHGARP